MQIINKYLKLIRSITTGIALLIIALVIVRNIPGIGNLYNYIKIILIIILGIWIVLFSTKKISEIRFLYKPLKYFVIACASVFVIIVVFLTVWYNCLFFPNDQDYLRKISESVKYNGNHLEAKELDLLRNIGNAKFSRPLLKKDHEFLLGNLRDRDIYVDGNPYGPSHPNNLKYSTGRIFYYIYQKNSFVLKSNSTVTYKVSGSKTGKRFLEFDAVFPALGSGDTGDGLINVFFTAGHRKVLLNKKINREIKPDIKPFRYSSPVSSIGFYLKHPGRSVLKEYTGWEKVRIDIPQEPGDLEIEFRYKEEDNNYLLIGSPAIYAVKDKKRNDHVNIVYLIFDTLSKSHIDLYEYYDIFSKMKPGDAYSKIGKAGILTPAIDGYADRACLFENMFTVGQVTRAAIMPLWTSQTYTKSRMPVFRNIVTDENIKEFNDQGFASLGNELSRAGYFTKQISCNAQGHGVSGVGSDLGFDENYDYTMEATEKTENFRRIIEFLNENQNRKFFLYSHINVPHTPRWIPMRYVLSSLPVVGYNINQAVMLGNIRYLNDSLQKLFNAMEKLKLTGNTIIVITADHSGGRAAYMRGSAARNSPDLSGRDSQSVASFHSRSIYGREGGQHLLNEYMNIPWVLIPPSNINFPSGKISSYISSLDISPTFLDITLNRANPGFSGKSFKDLLLRKDNRDKREFSGFIPLVGRFQRGFIVNGRFKYWINIQGLYKYRTDNKKKYIMHQEYLYDLQNDPNEVNNLAHDEYKNDILKKMRKIFFGEFNDYPDKNFFQISPSSKGEANRYSIKVRSANGVLIYPKTYGEGIKYEYKTNSEIIFNCEVKSKPVFFSFESNPPDAALTIDINRNGASLNRKNIFSTVECINFFDNPIRLNDKADFHIAREPGKTGLEVKDMPGDSVYYSRIPLNYWLEMNMSDKDIKLSPGIKEVLRGWGYIQ